MLGPDLSHVRRFGTHGREPGQFSSPQSIAVHGRAGLVYVADTCNHRIQARREPPPLRDIDARTLIFVGRLARAVINNNNY